MTVIGLQVFGAKLKNPEIARNLAPGLASHSTSASSIRLPNGSAKKASLRLIAGRVKGSATIATLRDFSVATVLSMFFTVRQK